MTVHFNAITGSVQILPIKEKKLPITVNWNSTIQKLSTDLKGYDMNLELSATQEMLHNFFYEGREEHERTAVLKAEKPINIFDYYYCTDKAFRFSYGASILVGILAGQIPLNQVSGLVRDLGKRHQKKANELSLGVTEHALERTILQSSFSIDQTHNSFSVEEVHQLAQKLKAL